MQIFQDLRILLLCKTYNCHNSVNLAAVETWMLLSLLLCSIYMKKPGKCFFTLKKYNKLFYAFTRMQCTKCPKVY